MTFMNTKMVRDFGTPRSTVEEAPSPPSNLQLRPRSRTAVDFISTDRGRHERTRKSMIPKRGSVLSASVSRSRAYPQTPGAQIALD
jgi:hypothetical protein